MAQAAPASGASSASSGLTTGLARKLKKVLEIRTDSPDLLLSLSALSSFYDQNSAQNRKNLRSTIERRGLSINEEFLEASEAAQHALDVVEAEVRGLAECCDRIGRALSTCASSTGDMVEATERLRNELDSTRKKQQLVAAFLHNYQLTADEVAALRENELDERFFAALSRVHEIHSNCKVLLRTHHQRAGLELMDVMAVYQDAAYDRLCRWVQSECRQLGDGDTPEVSALLKTAAQSLKERPMLFKYCTEEVANTRHYALLPRFIAALTRGGPGGMPRPIEVHAHDPLRYVGDMLAWLHQALASERELATSLFGEEPADDAPLKRTSSEGADRREGGGDEAGPPAAEKKGEGAGVEIAAVLDRVFEAVCRPFKVRVEQVLVAGQPSLTLAYKLTNLLSFYSHTFSGLLGPSAAFSQVLAELLQAAQRTVSDTIKTRGDKLLRFPPLVPADLAPPRAVAETMAQIQELIDAYNSMMVPAGAEKPDFGPILAGLLDPLILMCEKAAEAHGAPPAGPAQRGRASAPGAGPAGGVGPAGAGAQPLASPSSARFGPGATRRSGMGEAVPAEPSEGLEVARLIFLTNCLAAMQQPLVPFSIAAAQVARLGDAIQVHIIGIVRKEVAQLLARCKLAPVLAAMALGRGADGAPLAQVPEAAPMAVAEALRLLFATLARGADGQEGLPEFAAIQMPRLRSEAQSQVALAVAEAYAMVYQSVMDPQHAYPDPRSMLRHTPDQMRTILGV